MSKSSVDIKKMNEIVKNTIDTIEKGKNEIFDIAEKARSECRSIEMELEEVKKRTILVIDEVDKLEVLEKKSRQKLLIVSKDFKLHTEDDIRAAYEEAKDLQIKITLKRTEEKDLIKQRTDLERRLKNAQEVAKKAERLVSQVGVAMGYLNGNLQDVFEHLEDMQQKQIMGIRIIKAQEEERQRIARDIHDSPAQLIANLVIKTEICEKLIDMDIQKTRYELGQLKNIGRDCLKDIRKIIYDLRPMSLDDLGLVPTIQRYIINFEEETKVNVNLSVTMKHEKLDSIIQLTLFRVIQEALSNIRKHSNAKTAIIKLEVYNKVINMLIMDDGIGFEMDKYLKSDKEDSGFGLFSMRERIELLKGNVDIQSSFGKGTRIKVMVPLGEEEGHND